MTSSDNDQATKRNENRLLLEGITRHQPPSTAGMSKGEWEVYKSQHLSTAEQREHTRLAWNKAEQERRQRWEEGGFTLEWPDNNR